MWFLVALFVASLVISLVLTPKPKITNATPGKLSDVTFPRADEGSPVPRLYGTVKFKGGNTIYDGGFQAVAIRKKVKTGLFSSKHQTIGFKYYLTFDLAVCLGPGFIFRRLWFGNYEIWNGCLMGADCVNSIDINFPNLYGGQDSNGGVAGTAVMYCGNFDQPHDSYIQDQVFPDGDNIYPSYPGVAHIVFRNFWLGNSPSIQPPYVEGQMFPDSLGLGGINIMPNGLDMNPIGILHHIISDDWGCLDIDPNKINVDQWKSVAQTLFNEGLGASLICANANQASSAVGELLTMIAGTMFQDPATGFWDIILIRNDYNIPDLRTLGPGQITAVQDLTKTLWSQTFNWVRVSFTDRDQDYKENTLAQAHDFANIRFQNKPLYDNLTAESVYDSSVAAIIAARELSNVNIPLFSMTLVLDRAVADLKPGSVFVFNWPEYNIVSMVLRIRKFGLGTLEDGSITADCVQDVFSASNVVLAPPAPPPVVIADTSAKPIVDFKIFELPYWFDYNAFDSVVGLQSFGVFAKAPSAYSLGFNGYIVGIPEDAEVLDQAQYVNNALLNADLDQFDGWDNGVLPTLVIKTVKSPSSLIDDGSAVRTGTGLFMLNDEIMAYETFTDNGDGTYTLNNIYRALFDTVYASAAANDIIYFFEGADEFVEGQPIGQTFNIYLTDQTTTSIYDAASAVRTAETPVGRLALPIPPDNVHVDALRATGAAYAAGETVTVEWSPRNRFLAPLTVEFEADASDTPEAGAVFKLEIVKLSDNSVVLTQDDIDDVTVDVVLPAVTDSCMIKIWAKVDGVLSYTPALFPITIGGGVTVDGDRLVVDGNGVIV